MTIGFSFLLRKVVLEVLAGGLASLLVSPIVASIDKAVCESAAGKGSLFRSLGSSLRSLIRSPFDYLRSFEFLWLWSVNGVTYCMNNLVELGCTHLGLETLVPKLALVTLTNTVISIMKDKAFARKFGTSSKAGVSRSTVSLWILRDLLVVASAFVLPSAVARGLVSLDFEPKSASNLSQFLCPILIQFLATPIHILGLDLHNNPLDPKGKRVLRIARLSLANISIRMARSGTLFGIGGLGNKNLRSFFATLGEPSKTGLDSEL